MTPGPHPDPVVRTRPSSPRPLVGYAPGVFDMFHVGHLNLLRRARLACDHLVAGVVSDEVALQVKGRLPVVAQDERLAIVASMRFVDEVVLERDVDKVLTWTRVGFDVIYKGEDWRESAKGRQLERAFAPHGVTVVYLPYTEHTSTTRLRAAVPGGAAG